jgi:hypothetical protein
MINAKPLLFVVSLVLTLFTPLSAFARCDIAPDLSAIVAKFEATRISRVEALLRFGESQNLCLGIEYVDNQLLTELTDFHIHNLPVRETIKSILGQQRPPTIRADNGVIEIAQEAFAPETRTIFNYILPTFESRRAPVQDLSNALYLQFVSDLNPQITGFAGHYPPGDPEDEVGPFSEHDRSVRYLLGKLITQSKGAAWIARVPWKFRGDLTMVERGRVWAIVEYGVPKAGYASVLNPIAADLH